MRTDATLQQFRNDHPDWYFTTKLVDMDFYPGLKSPITMMRATFYREDGGILCTATGMGSGVERAETASIRRGLFLLGYGDLLHAEELDEKHRVVDKPIVPDASPTLPTQTKKKQIRLLIAGGRNYQFLPRDVKMLRALHDRHPIVEIVQGGATGADREAYNWARAHNIPTKTFTADWEQFGDDAGPIRNREMAAYMVKAQEESGIQSFVLLFPGGTGTNSMRQSAKKTKKLTVVESLDAIRHYLK